MSDRDDGVARAQAFYTRWARLYDVIAHATPGVEALRADAAAALAPSPGDVVVEMGCGTGANLRHLRERVGPDGVVVGVDFSPGMLREARSRVARNGWQNVHVVRGDATAPPVAEADAVVATFVMGMVSAPASVVRRWADLVGPGGRLALLDLARTTAPGFRALNTLFRGVVIASSPSGTRQRHADSPTAVLDRRVATAHQALRAACEDVSYSRHALGFARLSAGRVR